MSSKHDPDLNEPAANFGTQYCSDNSIFKVFNINTFLCDQFSLNWFLKKHKLNKTTFRRDGFAAGGKSNKKPWPECYAVVACLFPFSGDTIGPINIWTESLVKAHVDPISSRLAGC